MTNGRLDDIDNRILNIIQQDGRIEVVRLAKLVCLSPTPVYERIRKLQDAGFIKGFITLLDRDKIGLPVLVITLVKLDKQTKKLLHQFEENAERLPNVQHCLHLSGKWDFLLHIIAKTPTDYYNFLMEQLCNLPNVAHVESAFVLRESKSFSPFAL